MPDDTSMPPKRTRVQKSFALKVLQLSFYLLLSGILGNFLYFMHTIVKDLGKTRKSNSAKNDTENSSQNKSFHENPL